MTLLRGAASIAFAFALADVAPSCGSCGSRHTVVTNSPVWGDCGAHGPRYLLECDPTTKTECFDLKDVEGRYHCTRSCATDGDCSSLGPDYRCDGQADRYSEPRSRYDVRVCRKLSADGGRSSP